MTKLQKEDLIRKIRSSLPRRNDGFSLGKERLYAAIPMIPRNALAPALCSKAVAKKTMLSSAAAVPQHRAQIHEPGQSSHKSSICCAVTRAKPLER
jgi:hypothetical protein